MVIKIMIIKSNRKKTKRWWNCKKKINFKSYLNKTIAIRKWGQNLTDERIDE